MKDLKRIFEKTELTLKKLSNLSEKEFRDVFGKYKHYDKINRTDDEIFEILIMIIFFSGFRSSIVEQKRNIILSHFPDYKIVKEYTNEDIDKIMSDKRMIRHRMKINACIFNAKLFSKLVEHYGSFGDFLRIFNAKENEEGLALLRKTLMKFKYLSETTVNHFLTDLGYNLLKPDRVILRIFSRLGLINNSNDIESASVVGREFAIETGYPIRYIDIIFVKYGQKGESKEFGIEDGICLEENPKCDICGIQEFCNF